MYGLPDKIDLSFFRGRRLDQVRLGQYQAQLVFDGEVSVDLECDFTLDGRRHTVRDSYVLHVLLGLHVLEYRRAGHGDLVLGFDSHALLLHDSNETYESYTLRNGSDVTVV